MGMKSDLLQDAIGEVREDYVLDADTAADRGKSGWMKWGAMAACFCLVLAGVRLAFSHQASNPVQQWSTAFTPEQYFKHSDAQNAVSSGSFYNSVIPYAESRFFSDWREELERNSILPEIDTHPTFTLQVNYNADGSLYSLAMSWHRRDREGLANYSDLTVTAGYDEVPAIEDCIAIEIDDNGNVLEPAVTVTEREGIRIIAKGSGERDKTLTFQTENGWYQIFGSWNDSYDSVVELLDWFWVHPIDFDLFPIEKGDNYTYCSYSEMPGAFEEYLPSFEAFDYVCQEAHISLKNNVPTAFEGHYLSNITAEQAESGEYTIGENGCVSIHWCLETEHDFYDVDNCIGRLEELQEEQVMNLTPPDAVTTETRIKFMQGDYVVTIYASDVSEAWKLIASIR